MPRFLVEESNYRVRSLYSSFQKVMCKGKQPKTQTLLVLQRHPYHQKETALTTSSCWGKGLDTLHRPSRRSVAAFLLRMNIIMLTAKVGTNEMINLYFARRSDFWGVVYSNNNEEVAIASAQQLGYAELSPHVAVR